LLFRFLDYSEKRRSSPVECASSGARNDRQSAHGGKAISTSLVGCRAENAPVPSAGTGSFSSRRHRLSRLCKHLCLLSLLWTPPDTGHRSQVFGLLIGASLAVSLMVRLWWSSFPFLQCEAISVLATLMVMVTILLRRGLRFSGMFLVRCVHGIAFVVMGAAYLGYAGEGGR